LKTSVFAKVTILQVLDSEKNSKIWNFWCAYIAQSEFYIFGIWLQPKFEEILEKLNGLSFKVRLRGVYKTTDFGV
jgi:hypothetical protein